MRFEMNSSDVGALVHIITYMVDNVISTYNKNDGIGKQLIKSVYRIFKKVKMYGLKAYDVREDYRNEMTSLKEEIDYQKIRMGVKDDAKNTN